MGEVASSEATTGEGGTCGLVVQGHSEGLAVIKTFQGGEATFSSTRVTLTQIDHIASAAEMLQKLDLCRVLVRTAYESTTTLR